MAVGDLYETVIVQQLHGQTCLNVLHYQVTADVLNADTAQVASQIALAVRTEVLPALKNMQSYQVTHQGIRVQRILPLPRTAGAFDVGGNGAGSQPGDSLASHTAAVITKRTAFVGRAYRGRTFIAGISQADEAQSLLTSDAQDRGVTLAGKLTMAHALSGGLLVSVRPVLVSADRTRITAVTQGVLRITLHVQRRRTPGLGN